MTYQALSVCLGVWFCFSYSWFGKYKCSSVQPIKVPSVLGQKKKKKRGKEKSLYIFSFNIKTTRILKSNSQPAFNNTNCPFFISSCVLCLLYITSKLYSQWPSHNGLPFIYQTYQAHSCYKVFVLACPSDWMAVNGTFFHSCPLLLSLCPGIISSFPSSLP